MTGKKKFWKKFLWTIGILFGSLVIVTWVTGYSYIFPTLIHTYPDIDDINIFDSRSISNTTPQPWPVSSEYNKTKLSAELDSELLRNESIAFLVVKNDSLIYEQYWDGYGEESVSNSFSVAKSIVGVLAGVAVGEGLISLDDPVGKYVPEFRTGENAKLKIRHLLTMSSGLNWDESYSSLFSKTTEAYYGSDLLKLITGLKVVVEPGTKFNYMSCNTVLIAMAISKASGMTISEYAQQKLWMPLGATQPASWSLDHGDGLEKSYCCFYSTARDFAKVGKLYLDSGKWHGATIVPAAYVETSIAPNGIADESETPVEYYGYHWWLMDFDEHEIFYARGILGQYIIVIPDERLVVVRLGKKRGEKNNRNQLSDMVIYTAEALKLFGSGSKYTIHK